MTSYFTISGETSTVCKKGENILTSTSGLSYGTHTVTCTVKNDKNKTASAGYIIHPTFNFGGTKLNGIWVAKFEASGIGDNLTIIPNVNSISNNVINNMYWMSRNMLYYASNYGFNISKINTHMMKSIEWGSVAYLSNSIYGKYNNPSYSGVNKEIYINNYISSGSLLTITGCSSGGPTTATNSTSCPYRYDTNLSGTGASTTGTIYGIYDMNGGKYEYVMANMKNSSGGFSASASGLATAPEEKYYDTYNYSYNTSTDHSTRGLIGDSTKEAIVSLNTWYLGYAQLPTSLSPWIMRNGSGNDGQSASIFAFNNTTGGSSARVGFRPTLIVY